MIFAIKYGCGNGNGPFCRDPKTLLAVSKVSDPQLVIFVGFCKVRMDADPYPH